MKSNDTRDRCNTAIIFGHYIKSKQYHLNIQTNHEQHQRILNENNGDKRRTSGGQ